MPQHYVLGYLVDLYLQKHKLAIEIDEKGHMDRKKNKRIIRINPDEEDFDVFIGIGKIYNHINESNKKLTEESAKTSLIDKISKRLLELEFKKNNSIKSKVLKYVVKKYCQHYKTCKLIA